MQFLISQLEKKINEIDIALSINTDYKQLLEVAKKKASQIDWTIDKDHEKIVKDINRDSRNFEDKFEHILSLFSEVRHDIEVLKEQKETISEEGKKEKTNSIISKIGILEFYLKRKKQNLNIDKSIAYCDFGYGGMDRFFQDNFGYSLPKEMKIDDYLISFGRTIRQISTCHNLVECKLKNIKCPKIIDAAYFLRTIESWNAMNLSSITNPSNFNGLKHYYGIGGYGYGVNSNSFFYLRIDSWRRYYFRFNIGGLYAPFKKEAIGHFIKSFVKFENNMKGKVEKMNVNLFYDSLEIKIFHQNKEIEKNYRFILKDKVIDEMFRELENSVS